MTDPSTTSLMTLVPTLEAAKWDQYRRTRDKGAATRFGPIEELRDAVDLVIMA
jgi:hypothetical protein